MSFVVGMTGGIGSGKSTVAEAFVQLGAGLVDTDRLARELTAPGGAALTPLLEAFGPGVLAPDGGLDRGAMRRQVFADSAARARLENILHPLIRQAAQGALAELHHPYVLLAVPLLVETGRDRYLLDRVLVVDCPEELQVERVMVRNGLSRDAVLAIMAAQVTRTTRLAAADDVIDNSREPGDLLVPVKLLHGRYLEMAADKLKSV